MRERFYPRAIRRIGRDPSFENGTKPSQHNPSSVNQQEGHEGGRTGGENWDDKNNQNSSHQSRDSNSKLLWYNNFLQHPYVSLLYPRQLLQYITTECWLAGIGIGEKEFMSLSFPQIVRIQEPGQQHIGFLVAALQSRQTIFFKNVLSPPQI